MTEQSETRIDRLKQRYRLWKYQRAVRGAERAKQKRIELERGEGGDTTSGKPSEETDLECPRCGYGRGAIKNDGEVVACLVCNGVFSND